ncbi:hypothetical protein SporoP37_08960 [Sporosarcina sp. P37]|uniref:hypothetical protein n=1 Tax=unclassified Sporosarcina TaxID=2647733 RepID=UPI000A17DE6F|nr:MULTISPECIES: hypothetical protein [unclassified Sporosarcina]ARK24780.1 hypothetical protein SporoP37_08960 [Sporosarcina sp. P37]
MTGDWLDWVDRQEFEEMHMESKDGLSLTGYYLPAFPLLDNMSLLTDVKAGYSLKEADAFVPTEMTKELYAMTKSEAELFLADGANHGEAFVMEKSAYKQNVEKFLTAHLSHPAPLKPVN